MTLLSRFQELIHDMSRCGNVRISHTKVNDVLTPPPGFHFQFIYGSKDIRCEPGHPAEFFHFFSPE
jgi:hypothetical protein